MAPAESEAAAPGADHAAPTVAYAANVEVPAMGISQLASAIVESPTLKLNEEARILREKGEAVVHLGIGEPRTRRRSGRCWARP